MSEHAESSQIKHVPWRALGEGKAGSRGRGDQLSEVFSHLHKLDS